MGMIGLMLEPSEIDSQNVTRYIAPFYYSPRKRLDWGTTYRYPRQWRRGQDGRGQMLPYILGYRQL